MNNNKHTSLLRCGIYKDCEKDLPMLTPLNGLRILGKERPSVF